MNRILPLIAAFALLVAVSTIAVSHATSVNVIGKTSLYIFGVTQEPNGTIVGVPAMLNLTVTSGDGQIFIGSTPLAETDTQAQAVISTDTACRLLNVNCGNYNFYYFITSSSPEVGGPSAGGAFAIAAMSILSGKPLNKDVAMTGTANPDGSVGIVGDVSEKSEAAAQQGIKIFLYPSTDTISQSALQYDEKLGMVAIPIGNLIQAFNYFTGYNISYPLNYNIYTSFYNALMNNTYNLFVNYQNHLYDSLPQKQPQNTMALNYITQAQNAMLQESELNADNKTYVAASMAVNTSMPDLIMASVLEKAGSNLNAYLSNLINNEYSLIDQTYDNITSNYITNSSTLELKFIAIDRLAQADYFLNISNSSLSSNLETALYYYALAETKRISAIFWVSMLPKGSVSFSQATYQGSSMYYLYKASSYADYASLLGVNSPDQISLMNYYLNKANNYYNDGQYIPSIFDSLEALGTAQLIIEENSVINGSFSAINSQLSYMALRSIDEAESEGVTPFLGISYYQYANSFANSSEADLVQFYSDSMLYSEFETSLANATLQQIQPLKAPSIVSPASYLPPEVSALYVIFGFALGIIIGGVIFEYRLYLMLKKLKHKRRNR